MGSFSCSALCLAPDMMESWIWPRWEPHRAFSPLDAHRAPQKRACTPTRTSPPCCHHRLCLLPGVPRKDARCATQGTMPPSPLQAPRHGSGPPEPPKHWGSGREARSSGFAPAPRGGGEGARPWAAAGCAVPPLHFPASSLHNFCCLVTASALFFFFFSSLLERFSQPHQSASHFGKGSPFLSSVPLVTAQICLSNDS